MKTKVNYGKCEMFIEGLDMACPLCEVLVKSGEHHECSTEEQKPAKPVKCKVTPKRGR